jgi:hypothetical protein
VQFAAQRTLVAGDIYTYFYPMLNEGFTSLRSGAWPLWNPYQLCGLPLLATIQGGFFYPLHALHILLPMGQALAWGALAHLILGGAFMYGYIRSLRLGPLASIVGAVVWSYALTPINFLLQPHWYAAQAWFPLSFWSADRVARSASPRSAACLGIVLAMPFLAGAPQLCAHIGYALIPYSVLRLVQIFGSHVGGKASLRAALLLGAGAALATGIASVQLLPTMELAAQSTRTLGGMTLEATQFYDTPPASELARGLLAPLTGGRESFPYIYFGLAPLGLAGAGLFWRRHLGLRAFFLAVALLAFGLTSGTQGYLYELFYSLPTGDWFRAPSRFLVLFTFAAAVLAAFGAERVAALIPTTRSPAPGIRPLRSLAAAALLLAVGFDLALSYDLLGANRRIAHPAKGVEAMRSAARGLADVRERVGLDRVHLLRVSRPPHLGLLVKQGMANGLYVAADYEPLAPGRYADFFAYAEAGKEAPAGEQWQGEYRVVPPLRHPRLLALTSARYLLTDGPLEHRIGAHAVSLLGYRRLGDPSAADASLLLYENADAVPRAYVATTPRLASSPYEALLLLTDPAFDPLRDVVLEGVSAELAEALLARASGEDVGRDASARAEIAAYEPTRVAIDATTAEGGLLVLTDLHYPGWIAEVDKVPAEILRANYLFRAVRLDAGTHRVEFRYAPESFRRGGVVTLFAALAALAMIAWPRRRQGAHEVARRTGRPASPPDTPPRTGAPRGESPAAPRP